jgi:hypothetical protein
VYAWGSLDDDNLELAVQTISGLHSTPDGVNAGQAGLAANGSWASSLFAVLLLGGATALAGRHLRVRATERR